MYVCPHGEESGRWYLILGALGAIASVHHIWTALGFALAAMDTGRCWIGCQCGFLSYGTSQYLSDMEITSLRDVRFEDASVTRDLGSVVWTWSLLVPCSHGVYVHVSRTNGTFIWLFVIHYWSWLVIEPEGCYRLLCMDQSFDCWGCW